MYWAERIDEMNNLLFDRTEEQARRELANIYRTAYEDTKKEIEDLYDKLMAEAAEGKVKPNDLYRYNRYYDMQNNLTKRLLDLGYKENLFLKKELTIFYQGIQDIITKNGIDRVKYSVVSEQQIQKALNAIWCSDGKHWSNRIWNNKQLLQQRIEKGIIDNVIRGVPKDELVKTLMNDFNVGFNNADRIVRTELNFIQNEAAADRYMAAGVKQYEILAKIDSTTSDICREQNGKIYDFLKKEVGVNAPPFHPNCRTTIIPVLEV